MQTTRTRKSRDDPIPRRRGSAAPSPFGDGAIALQANEVQESRDELERMAALLEASGDYRLLRRLQPQSLVRAPNGPPMHRGIFLDVETTGLDGQKDSVIELAMLPFDYSTDGEIFAIHQPFSALRDPGRPIPAAVMALTGITDAMVCGLSIDPAEVEAFLGSAALVIAHNASFDRRFAESLSGAFVRLPWACSWAELPWIAEGFVGARLSDIAAGYGFFFDGHRALDDCRAGVEILARTLPGSGRSVLAVLLERARLPRWRISAAGAPYVLRGSLKARGYRWRDASEGRSKAWFIDVADDALEAELEFLRREIYRRPDADIDARRVTAFDRYSDRA
jgi:DNA polymerase III subunit epsilon